MFSFAARHLVIALADWRTGRVSLRDEFSILNNCFCVEAAISPAGGLLLPMKRVCRCRGKRYGCAGATFPIFGFCAPSSRCKAPMKEL
jgi:hypothetical protein